MKRYYLVGLLVFVPLYSWRLWQQPDYNLPVEQAVVLKGRITSQPYLKGSNQVLKVGPIWVITDRYPEYFYGQDVQLNGTLEVGASNLFEKQYLANFPTIEIVKRDGETRELVRLINRLASLRRRVEKLFCGYLEEPLGGLVSGIVLGSRSGLPTDFSQKLRETGTIHAVVASGQNIALLIWLLTGLFGLWVKRSETIFLTATVIGGYVLMTGAEPPVVRAAVMAGVVTLARQGGRDEQAGRALVIAIGLMLLFQPRLVADLGFQLSVAATAGLTWLVPVLAKFKPLVGGSFVMEAMRCTLAAQLAVTPLLLVSFGNLSVVAPLVNGLVVWMTAPVMVLGLFSGLTGLVLPVVGQVIAWIIWPLAKIFVVVVEAFAELSYAQTQLKGFSWAWVAGYYAVLVMTVRVKKLNDAKRREPC